MTAIPPNHPLARTAGLFCQAPSLHAIDAVVEQAAELPAAVVRDALFDLATLPRTAKAMARAVKRLAESTPTAALQPDVWELALAALESPHPLVRLAALDALDALVHPFASRTPSTPTQEQTREPQARTTHVLKACVLRGFAAEQEQCLARICQTDVTWTARQRAVRLWLGALEDETLAAAAPVILSIAEDPHWRVRHTLIEVLRDLRAAGRLPELRALLLERGVETAGGVRSRGVLRYLRYCWSDSQAPEDPREAEPPRGRPLAVPDSLWDGDAAVLARDLARLLPAAGDELTSCLPELVRHPEARVQRVALRAMLARGAAELWRPCLGALADPREFCYSTLHRALERLSVADRRMLVTQILKDVSAGPGELAWALDQVGARLPWETAEGRWTSIVAQQGHPECVDFAALRLAVRSRHPERRRWLQQFVCDGATACRAEAAAALAEDPAPEDRWWLEMAGSALAPERAVAAAALVRQEAAEEGPARGAAVWQPLARDPSWRVRAAFAGALASGITAARRGRPGNRRLWARLLEALGRDEVSVVRAAALTAASARRLLDQPARESSWRVLARAAQLLRRPLSAILPPAVDRGVGQPRPSRVKAAPWPGSESCPGPLSTHQSPRPLGTTPHRVLPLGLSGHYGLPEAGFAAAWERGINLFFWEPNYDTMTRFCQQATEAQRAQMRIICGTFEADAAGIRRDVERALRQLRVPRIALFLMFWVRSWRRIDGEVLAALRTLREEGLVEAFSLSTHSRALGLEAIRGALDERWNPLMIRYSAAHRGAERELFPAAASAGTQLIAFNNTCYGRLLRPVRDSAGISPLDCYRYALGRSEVSFCLTAPATSAQLDENLRVLDARPLSAADRERIEAHGALVYRDDCVFRDLVRGVR